MSFVLKLVSNLFMMEEPNYGKFKAKVFSMIILIVDV